MFYADVALAANARLPIAAEHEQRAIYVIHGRIDIDGNSFDASQLVVLRPGQALTVLALGPVQLLLLGGAALDGPRHVWLELCLQFQRAHRTGETGFGATGGSAMCPAMPNSSHCL